MYPLNEEGYHKDRFDQPGQADPSSRTPHPCIPSQIREIWRGLKKGTRLGLFLYLQAHNSLDDRQCEYIAHFQAKLNLSEIQSALKFMHVLTTNPRIRARIWADSFSVPFYRPRPNRRDQRRIGVGYKDKGSLPKRSRPSWDKDNTVQMAEPTIWRALVLDLQPHSDLPSGNPEKETDNRENVEKEKNPLGEFTIQDYFPSWNLRLETLSIDDIY